MALVAGSIPFLHPVDRSVSPSVQMGDMSYAEYLSLDRFVKDALFYHGTAYRNRLFVLSEHQVRILWNLQRDREEQADGIRFKDGFFGVFMETRL